MAVLRTRHKKTEQDRISGIYAFIPVREAMGSAYIHYDEVAGVNFVLKKMIILTAAAAMLLPSAAYAAEPGVEFDYNTGRLTIQGTTSVPNETVTLNILKPGVTIEQLYLETGDSILHNDYTVSDGQGAYSFVIPIPDGTEKGQYSGYIGAASFDSAEEFVLAYMSSEEYAEAIGRLNDTASSAEDFKNALAEVGTSIGFSNPLTDSIDGDKAAEILRAAILKNKLDASDSIGNKRVYDTAIVMQAFNENKMTDFAEYADRILINNMNTVTYYTDIISKGAGNAVFHNFMSGKDITDMDDFEICLEDAVMIAVTNYPDGIGNLEKVLKEYKSRTGAKTDKAKSANYSAIAGKSYNNISELISAFNKSVDSNGTDGGSSTGSGSRPSGGSGNGIIGGTANPANPVKPELTIKFEDLNSVPWAYEAISKLFAADVISGRSETIFAPNDFVTREEFAKLVVSAFDLADDSFVNNFTDVPAGAWYEKYVCSAAEKGICKGIGDSKFGVGSNITRQDMCVMIYNALQVKGKNLEMGALDFADSEKIADYAAEAIAALANGGVVSGIGDNQFDPQGLATRAQAAVIINNALEK